MMIEVFGGGRVAMRNFSKLGGFGVSCASENGRFSSRQPSYCVSAKNG
jgi:hypothetical protein